MLRTFRVLRPLRTLSTVPGLRALVVTVFSSLPKLGSAVALCLFINLIFSLIGMTFFGGKLNRRCRLTKGPIEIVLPPALDSGLMGLWNAEGDLAEVNQYTAYPHAYEDWVSPYNTTHPHFANPSLHPWANSVYPISHGSKTWTAYGEVGKPIIYGSLSAFQTSEIAGQCATFCINMQGWWKNDEKTRRGPEVVKI